MHRFSFLRLRPWPSDQQFFISWGQFRGDAIRPEMQRMMIQGNEHPISIRFLGQCDFVISFRPLFFVYWG
jgi:putative endopeptidase